MHSERAGRANSNRVSPSVGGEITKSDFGFPSSGADRFGYSVGSAFVATMHHDRNAFRSEQLRNRLAYPGTRSCYQCPLSCQS